MERLAVDDLCVYFEITRTFECCWKFERRRIGIASNKDDKRPQPLVVIAVGDMVMSLVMRGGFTTVGRGQEMNGSCQNMVYFGCLVQFVKWT